jgi:regulator of CtrA degradation
MDTGLTGRLIAALYEEALQLAEEARIWFDTHGPALRKQLPPVAQVGLASEALKVTTRLMHVHAWLFDRRGVARGERDAGTVRFPSATLHPVVDGDPELLAQLPFEALSLIEASRDLYERVARMAGGIEQAAAAESPARGLFQRLEDAF